MIHKINISVRRRRNIKQNFDLIDDSQKQTMLSTKTPLCWLADHYFIIVRCKKGLSFLLRLYPSANCNIICFQVNEYRFRHQAITKINATLLSSEFYEQISNMKSASKYHNFHSRHAYENIVC